MMGRAREFILLEKDGNNSRPLYEGSLEEVAEFAAMKTGQEADPFDAGFNIWEEEDG